MIKTGTETVECIFAGDINIRQVMVGGKVIYPQNTDYIEFPEVVGHDNSVFIFTIKVNQFRTNWRAVDFSLGSSDRLWQRYVQADPYMISFYRTSGSIPDWKTPTHKSYIEGIYIQRCVFGCSTTNVGRDLPNLTTIKIGDDITRLKSLHALGWNSPRLKYVLASLTNFTSDFTTSDYICGDSGIKYLEAVDTHQSSSYLLRGTAGARLRPSSDEMRWLTAPWGNRHEMSNLRLENKCTQSVSTLTKHKKFSQFKYVPIRLHTVDKEQRKYNTLAEFGWFNENGIEFSRQSAAIYSGPYISGYPPSNAFDGNRNTFFHFDCPLGDAYLSKSFNAHHQLDFVRMKARGSNASRNVSYFWMLGRNSDTDEWEHVASIDCAPNYSDTWGDDEQRGWGLRDFQPLFSVCETDHTGLFIKFNVGREGDVDLVKYNIISPDRIFTLRINGVEVGIKTVPIELYSPGFTTDVYFQINGRVNRGDTVELDYDSTNKTLYAVDSRIRGKSGYGGYAFLPSSNNMHVKNNSTFH